MYYKFVDLPSEGVAEQVLSVSTTSTHQDIVATKNRTFRFSSPDAYVECPALVHAVEKITSWSNVLYVALVHTPPGVVDIHVDFDGDDYATAGYDVLSPDKIERFHSLFANRHATHLSPWALNFPIANCDVTYTAFYKQTERTVPRFQIHPVNDFPYYKFELDELEEADRLYLTQPAFFNTQEIHGAVNNSDQDRLVLTVRFNFNLADQGWI
jgi:hypothetical protein